MMKYMKAYLSYDGVLHVESQTEEEKEALYKFASEGAQHGFYHYASSLSPDRATLAIAPDK